MALSAKAFTVANIINSIIARGGRVLEATLEVNATIAANSPAGTEVVANITTDPKSATTERVVTIPSTQEWYITDIFIKASGDVGVESVARVLKNQRDVKFESPPLSSLLVTNPSRPDVPPAPILFEPLSRLSINVVNIAAVGTSQVTVTFYIKVLIGDFS